MKKQLRIIINNVYLYSVISKLLGVITGVLYIILFTRYLGPELKGISAIILNSVSISAIILDLGLHQAYARFKKLDGDILLKYLSNIIGLFIIYLLLAILAVIVIPLNLQTKVAILIIPLTIMIRQLNFIVLVENPKRRNSASIFLNLFDLVLISIFISFTVANFTMLVTFLLAKEIIYLIVAVSNLKIKLSNIQIRFDELVRYIKYGYLPMLTLLLMTINYRIDIIMLDGKVSVSEIGIYALGVSIAEKIWLIPDALKDSLISRLTSGKGENEVAKIIRISIFFCLIGIALLLLFGEVMINMLFGSDFKGAFDITAILLFGVVSMVFYKMIYSFNIVQGKRMINFVFLGISALVNILGNFIFIPQYGISGAAMTSVISYMICGMMFLIYFIKVSGISSKDILFLKKTDFIVLVNKFKPKRELSQ